MARIGKEKQSTVSLVPTSDITNLIISAVIYVAEGLVLVGATLGIIIKAFIIDIIVIIIITFN